MTWGLCHDDSGDGVVTVLLIFPVVVDVSLLSTTIMLHNKVLQTHWLKITVFYSLNLIFIIIFSLL